MQCSPSELTRLLVWVGIAWCSLLICFCVVNIRFTGLAMYKAVCWFAYGSSIFGSLGWHCTMLPVVLLLSRVCWAAWHCEILSGGFFFIANVRFIGFSIAQCCRLDCFLRLSLLYCILACRFSFKSLILLSIMSLDWHFWRLVFSRTLHHHWPYFSWNRCNR